LNILDVTTILDGVEFIPLFTHCNRGCKESWKL